MKGRNKVFIIIVTLSVVIMGVTAVLGYNQISKRKEDYTMYLRAKEMAKGGNNVSEAIEALDKIESKYGDSDVIKLDKADIYLKANMKEEAQIELANAFVLNHSLYTNTGLMKTYAKIAKDNGDKNTAVELLNKINDVITEEEEKAKESKTKVSKETKELKVEVKNMMDEMK